MQVEVEFSSAEQKRRVARAGGRGFTLIELLVVIAIIGLLSSIVLVAVYNARAKGRDAKRVGDMSRMVTAFELFYNTNRGYPAATGNGIPADMTPAFIASQPESPLPADGGCDLLDYPNGEPATTYFYAPTGTASVVNGLTVYPNYNYYFCLGGKTGDLVAGTHALTPKGIR